MNLTEQLDTCYSISGPATLAAVDTASPSTHRYHLDVAGEPREKEDPEGRLETTGCLLFLRQEAGSGSMPRPPSRDLEGKLKIGREIESLI